MSSSDKVDAADKLAHAEDRAATREAELLVSLVREVAGHARCLGAMMGGGGSHATHKRALITALDVCAAHFGVRGDG